MDILMAEKRNFNKGNIMNLFLRIVLFLPIKIVLFFPCVLIDVFLFFICEDDFCVEWLFNLGI